VLHCFFNVLSKRNVGILLNSYVRTTILGKLLLLEMPS